MPSAGVTDRQLSVLFKNCRADITEWTAENLMPKQGSAGTDCKTRNCS